jgi:hypothetical protein
MRSKHALNVPTVSITEVRKSPTRVFNLAAKKENAVYVSSHGMVVGVMLTPELFKSSTQHTEELEDRLIDAEAAPRPADTSTRIHTDTEIRGGHSTLTFYLDVDDGWK